MSSVINDAMSAEAGTVVAGRPLPEFRRIGVTPITGAAGCAIDGVDLRRLPEGETLAEIVRLLAGHDLNHLAQLERL